MDPPLKDAVLRHRVISRETYVIPTGISLEIRGKESAGKVLRKDGSVGYRLESCGVSVGTCLIPVGSLSGPYGSLWVPVGPCACLSLWVVFCVFKWFGGDLATLRSFSVDCRRFLSRTGYFFLPE